MTDKELIARLRGVCDCNIDSTPCIAEEECRDAFAAADRIEALHNEWRFHADGWSDALDRIEVLVKERDEAEQRGYANAMEAERKLHEDRIEELEAKLAKAVKVLEEIAGNGNADGRNPQLMSDKARAALKGDDQ